MATRGGGARAGNNGDRGGGGPATDLHPLVQTVEAEYDDEGVYFYQAFNDAIAGWAVANQRFGGPGFSTTRMFWIKPSFAWMLYRSGYASKSNQSTILKVKVAHAGVAAVLACCECTERGGSNLARVQWDPARDLYSSEAKGKAPRKLLRKRAIQIGIKGKVARMYLDNILSIKDVTPLAHLVGDAHKAKEGQHDAMETLAPQLPNERPYVPTCTPEVLCRLGMLPGEVARAVAGFGLGKAVKTP